MNFEYLICRSELIAVPKGHWKLAGGAARNERHHRIRFQERDSPGGAQDSSRRGFRRPCRGEKPVWGGFPVVPLRSTTEEADGNGGGRIDGRAG
jgi:hypothetical protein